MQNTPTQYIVNDLIYSIIDCNKFYQLSENSMGHILLEKVATGESIYFDDLESINLINSKFNSMNSDIICLTDFAKTYFMNWGSH